MAQTDDAQTLKALMQQANIASYRALAQTANVSRWQIQQLRGGKVEQMRVAVLAQVAEALQISLAEILRQFGRSLGSEDPVDHADRIKTDALQVLETWLVQWPTIVKRAEDKGEALPAVKILPFVRPVALLMREWQVEAIAPVDAQIPYDPRLHQLIDGNMAEAGALVRVTHSGCLYQGKLLHRAKVKLLSPGDS
ncbi:MAG: helix-turn-helix transcriptional regulator [Phormidesmis sp.]